MVNISLSTVEVVQVGKGVVGVVVGRGHLLMGVAKFLPANIIRSCCSRDGVQKFRGRRKARLEWLLLLTML